MRFLTASAIITGALLMASINVSAAPKVIYLDDSFPGSSARFSSQLKLRISRGGFAIESVNGDQLAERLSAENGPGSILVMPNSPYLPISARESLLSFLKKGNHLFAVSGPALSSMAVHINDKWLTREDAKSELSAIPGDSILDLSKPDPAKWDRNTGILASPVEMKVEPSGNAAVPDCLHVKVSKLDKWDLVRGVNIPVSFPNGSTATAFWAKGGAGTPELVFEWREKDGSRWMSTSKLTPEWKRYVLTPDDFRFWPDTPPPGRGGESDKFNPANAAYFSFGLADGISNQKLGIAHEYWISDVRGIKDSSGGYDFTPPILESLSPHYKTFTSQISRVKDIGTGRLVVSNTTLVSPIMRPLGLGIDALRKWRFIPVLQGYDTSGEKRGVAAHLFLNSTGDYAGSIFGYIGFSQDYLEKSGSLVIPIIIRMMKRMANGAFLANGGTEHFAYADGEKVKYGAYITNLTGKPISAQFEVIITDGKSPYRFRSKRQAIPSRNMASPVLVKGVYGPSMHPGEYTVKTRLIQNGNVVDDIDHPLKVIKYGPVNEREIVSTKGSDFYLDGKRWYPLGINYWPSSSNGNEEGNDWLFWLSPELYNPELVEEDLAIAQKLKMNVMSIAYYKEAESRQLMDFLDRAKMHGIKVHVYMPGLYPLSQDFPTANKMIQAAHLPESTSFFAYDLGWEVHIGNYDARKPFDKDWQKWVVDRYGSIEAAMKDWAFKPETIDGSLTGPKDDQLSNDGDWRKFVAAYRRFMDDRISKGYQQVRDDIKSLDKYHLMGARSGWAGLGSMWAVPAFPFDIFSGAKHLDFMSPEGYAIYGDRKQFLEGGFDNAYCSFSSGGKPSFWVEYAPAVAVGIDPLVYGDHTPEMLERQREYYQNMLRMTFETSSNGSAGWWWPAGTRLGENSDLGIIRADGVPRPAALEITKAADWFHRDTDLPKPDFIITADRDKYISGYAGLRADLVRSYVDAFLAGKIPAIHTEGSGTTSANTPLTAVGDLPYNGQNPPKYLNAEFNWLKINATIVKGDATVSVKRGESVTVEASIGNTAEASWVSGRMRAEQDGDVRLSWKSVGPEGIAPIADDTPFLADASVPAFRLSDGIQEPTTYTFHMTARNRMDFGEVVRITLNPE